MNYYDPVKNLFYEDSKNLRYLLETQLVASNIPRKYFDSDFSIEFPGYTHKMRRFFTESEFREKKKIDHLLIMHSNLGIRQKFLVLLVKKLLESRTIDNAYFLPYSQLMLTTTNSWENSSLNQAFDLWKRVQVLAIQDLVLPFNKDNNNSLKIIDLLTHRENNRLITVISTIISKEELCRYYNLDPDLYLILSINM